MSTTKFKVGDKVRIKYLPSNDMEGPGVVGDMVHTKISGETLTVQAIDGHTIMCRGGSGHDWNYLSKWLMPAGELIFEGEV